MRCASDVIRDRDVASHLRPGTPWNHLDDMTEHTSAADFGSRMSIGIMYHCFHTP